MGAAVAVKALAVLAVAGGAGGTGIVGNSAAGVAHGLSQSLIERA